MNTLIIMAGGASSRMKRSIENVKLSESDKAVALKAHKSLIPLGLNKKPLLFYLISNAVLAGYKEVYLITSPENKAFKAEVGIKSQNNYYAGAEVHYAIQNIPEGKKKPLGTSDAILQAMDQYPILKRIQFSICNGDNLYSTTAMKLLRMKRKTPHATIGFARTGMRFSNERISKFAVISVDLQGYLEQIIEKPDTKTIETFKDKLGETRLSMNIFSFDGKLIYPYLKNCPINIERGEKELPEAVRRMIKDFPKQLFCFPLSEHLPDLTSADDIKDFSLL